MKTKRTAVVAFLLCAIMAIGIGFAAISKNLEISGNANLGMDATGFSVEFVQSGCETDDGDVSSIVISGDPTVATFTVNGLKKAGDKVVGTFTIKNTSSEKYDVLLGEPSISFGTGAFVDYIEVTKTNPVLTRLSNEGANSTTTFTITVELKKVINDASAQVTFVVLISATSALPL